MPALFVHKSPHLEETLRNSLAPLWEQDSIYFCHTYEEAETFINNVVIGEQRQLDMIICENNIGGLSAVDFYKRITKDRDRTFSNGHFYFHTIPVVLILDEWENRTALRQEGFSDVLDDIALDNLWLYSYDLASIIKEWRRRLLGDLSNIGIPYEGGRLIYTYLPSEKKRQGRYTSIITDTFKKTPTRLLYDWIASGERHLEIAIGKLEKEMKRVARLNTRDEDRISDLLRKYPILVKRDNYSKHWREAVLPLEGRNSYRFDVSLRPHFNQLSDLNVVELKLPNEKLIVHENFHPGFSAEINWHIYQVNDYKAYMRDKKRKPQIKEAFGFVPKNVAYTIIVGRLEEKERHQEIIERRLDEFKAPPQLKTYDEFVKTNIDYLARRDLLSIF